MLDQMVRSMANRLRSRGGFVALFCAYVLALALALEHWQEAIGPVYLYSVSWAARLVLSLAGIAAGLDAAGVRQGLCVLTMERAVFHVTYECSGISAVVIYLAAVLAYPTTARHRLTGLLLGGVGLFVYSALRLVVLGVVARFWPSHTQFFHVYLLVLMNVGFMLYLWASWVRRAPREAAS